MRGKIPQLDAVRGWAILLVMFHNSGYFPRLFADGWMGVDLFFVLSGFLITGILVDTRESEGYFKNFYARRCLRIWPLYYSLLALMFVIIPLMQPNVGHIIFAKSTPWWSYPFYLQNFFVLVPTEGAGPLGTTWSLAIEEQFYLIWALVVKLCSPARLQRIAIAVICLSPAIRAILQIGHAHIYSNLFCRLDGLMAGAFLALLVRSRNFDPKKYLKPAWILLLLTAILALALAHFDVQTLVYSASALASAMFVYVALFSRQSIFQRVMRLRFLTYTGTISYGLYLLHKFSFDWLKMRGQAGSPLLFTAAALAASYAMAIVSWYLLEKPFLRLKRFFEFRTERNPAINEQNMQLAALN